MKKKTLNAQRRTLNIEFKIWRVGELPDEQYEDNHRPAYDLENRLLKFAADIVRRFLH